MPLDDLSNQVADLLSDDPTGATASTVRQTEIQLHHTHLPLLDDAGVIEYDPSERRVTYLNDERLDGLLETAAQILESLRSER